MVSKTLRPYLSTLISVFLTGFRYFSYQVATQLSSRGWVDPVPDPKLPEKFLGYSRESNSGPLGWQSDVLTTIPNWWSTCCIRIPKRIGTNSDTRSFSNFDALQHPNRVFTDRGSFLNNDQCDVMHYILCVVCVFFLGHHHFYEDIFPRAVAIRHRNLTYREWLQDTIYPLTFVREMASYFQWHVNYP